MHGALVVWWFTLTWVVDPRLVLHPWLSLTQGYGHKWKEEEPTFASILKKIYIAHVYILYTRLALRLQI